jgi:uncharacterized protein YkwD
VKGGVAFGSVLMAAVLVAVPALASQAIGPRLPDAPVAVISPNNPLNWGATPTQASSFGQAAQVYQRLMQVRATNGAAPIQRHPGLDAVAQRWAASMAARGVLEHQPDLAMASTQALGGGWNRAAENVAYARSIDQVMVAFRESPGHHKNNIGNYDLVGIGVATDADGRVWVAIQFAGSRPQQPQFVRAGF